MTIQRIECGKDAARFIENMQEFISSANIQTKNNNLLLIGTIKGIPVYLNLLFEPNRWCALSKDSPLGSINWIGNYTNIMADWCL